MRKTLGIRLLLAYNALFRWRRRKQKADGWNACDWDDEAAGIAYAEWRRKATAEFLRRFPPIEFRGKTVLDFGCSHGGSMMYYAQQGAGRVIGVDIADDQLRLSQRYLRHMDPERALPIEVRKCTHTSAPVDDASIDLLMCADVFEHLQQPERVLQEWQRILKPGGRAYVSFGPLWYHPHGVHLWECFPAPWTHVLFPEKTVVAARHFLKRDSLDPTRITHYRDLGFNRMTVSRFRKLVRRSGLEAEVFELCPVRRLKPLVWLPGVRELFATEVHCVLRRRGATAPTVVAI